MSDKASYISRTSETTDEPQRPVPSYRGLFRFCTKTDLLVLLPALLSSLASGLIIPAFTILLGRIFTSFGSFSSNTISDNELQSQVTVNVIGITIVGAAAWGLGWCHMALWLAFGENMAKRAREQIMDGLMEKSMTWFDTRVGDVGVSGYVNKAAKYSPTLRLADADMSKIYRLPVRRRWVWYSSSVSPFWYRWGLD